MEKHCQKGPESLEHQGGMGHYQGTMERYMQYPLPRTWRRRRNVRKEGVVHDLKVALVQMSVYVNMKMICEFTKCYLFCSSVILTYYGAS